MTTVAEPEPETQGQSGKRPVRWLRHRLAAGVASGLILWTAFPPMEWGLLDRVAVDGEAATGSTAFRRGRARRGSIPSSMALRSSSARVRASARLMVGR